MANQIARNFGTKSDPDASKALADHISHYWDPRMKSRIIEHLNDSESDLSPVATNAIRIVAIELKQSG